MIKVLWYNGLCLLKIYHAACGSIYVNVGVRSSNLFLAIYITISYV